MIIKGYANYGVLAHEKQTIFTVAAPHPRTKVAEKVEITIPDGWEVSENATGEKLIGTPDGKTYLAANCKMKRPFPNIRQACHEV